MDLKLTQRIILKYYRAKFKLLEKLSPQKAAQSLLQLFFTPYVTHANAERPPVFHKAEKISFQFNGYSIHGSRWVNKNNTRTVLVCHGMNSCSYRFDKFIQRLLQHNLNVLAFDAQAHGKSEGKILNAVIYSEIILEIENLFGPVDAILSHSLAGMATCFAMEQTKNTHKKIVLIAPATETISAVDNFFKLLHLSQPLRNVFEETIIQTRGKPSAWYSSVRAIQNFKSPVLWIHDTDDDICPYADTIPVQQLGLPHIQFVTTSGLGHNKIYRDQQVQKTVIDFLTA